jgi:hypothetical protein
MKVGSTDMVFLATSIALSDIVWTGGRFVPIIYRALFRTESEADIRLSLMPAITRLASDFSLLFVAIICLTGFAAVLLSRTRHSQAWVLLGATSQCFVAWTACFCFCFDSFTGGMCLHHGPEFEIGRFVTTAWGVFPITLATLLVLFAVAVRSMRKTD